MACACTHIFVVQSRWKQNHCRDSKRYSTNKSSWPVENIFHDQIVQELINDMISCPQLPGNYSVQCNNRHLRVFWVPPIKDSADFVRAVPTFREVSRHFFYFEYSCIDFYYSNSTRCFFECTVKLMQNISLPVFLQIASRN